MRSNQLSYAPKKQNQLLTISFKYSNHDLREAPWSKAEPLERSDGGLERSDDGQDVNRALYPA